jgi:cobalamin biosynthetic protein CobC
MADSATLMHGGRVRAAAHAYRIAVNKWLDLSTGINPQGWPVPPVPPEVWRCLPEDDDGLYMATTAHFGNTAVLPVAGTQAAIQVLPRLRASSGRGMRIGVLAPTYAEHMNVWRAAGCTVNAIAIDEVDVSLADIDVLIVVNPDNPTGRMIDPSMLFAWHERLAARGGWLIVDEAFIDATPAASIAGAVPLPGLIVLRSLGKFWGLAGVRLGFVLAEPDLLTALRADLGPWHVSHPARWVAQRALMDREWCEATRARLFADSERLSVLLAAHGLPSPSGCALFRWVPTPHAAQVHDALARQAVLVRSFDDGLRFGLPGDESAWSRLDAVLGEVMQ